MNNRDIDYDNERELAHIITHIFKVSEADGIRMRDDIKARGNLIEVTDPNDLPAECWRRYHRLYTGFEFALFTVGHKCYEWRRHLEPLTDAERERVAERVDRALSVIDE